MRELGTLSDKTLLSYSSNLRSKVIIVTGAGSGFGRAFSLLAASNGAKVVIADVNVENLESLKKEIETSGVGEAVAVKCDVTKWEEQVEMFEVAVRKWGKVDSVIVNAGIGEISRYLPLKKNIGGTYDKPVYKQVDVNYIGALWTIHLAITYLPQGAGTSKTKSIVILGSVASFFGLPFGSLYASTKHGLRGLFLSLSSQLSSSPIKSTLIAPWFVDTPILNERGKALVKDFPLATVDDVVKGIFYAVSAPAEEVNEKELVIDFKGVCKVSHEFDGQNVYGMLAERGRAISWLHSFGRGVAYFQWKNAVMIGLLGLLIAKSRK